MLGIEQAETLLAFAFGGRLAHGLGPGRVHELDIELLVHHHDRRGDLVQEIHLFPGVVHGLFGLCDVEHILQGTGDGAVGILDGRARVLDGQVDAARVHHGLAAEDPVLVHGPGAAALRGPAVGGLEQVVALHAHDLIGGFAHRIRARGIHVCHGKILVDGHDRGGDEIEHPGLDLSLCQGLSALCQIIRRAVLGLRFSGPVGFFLAIGHCSSSI